MEKSTVISSPRHIASVEYHLTRHFGFHPDLKRTLVAMSERIGMSVSQVPYEVLYTGLIEMQELPEHEE